MHGHLGEAADLRPAFGQVERRGEPATGAISGQYISRSDADSWPAVGWVNTAPAARSATDKAGKGDHADVFTLLVLWGDRGSTTAWTGTCTVNTKSGLAQISTLWHTARPNTGFEWDHLLIGSEVLFLCALDQDAIDRAFCLVDSPQLHVRGSAHV